MRLRRGADGDKDQSYVLSMLGQPALGRVVFLGGEMTKTRCAHPRPPGSGCAPPASRTARMSASSTRSRGGPAFWPTVWPFHPGEVVDLSGQPAGTVEAIELVTLGQRRGMGHGTDGAPPLRGGGGPAGPRRVTVGNAAAALTESLIPLPGSLR